MKNTTYHFSRRKFLGSTLAATSLLVLKANELTASKPSWHSLKLAVDLPHFPDRLHAFIWRNWLLVPTERIAKVCKAPFAEVLRIGKAMGLPAPRAIPSEQQERSYLTIIRSNWHVLPREQLLELLDWSDEQLTFTLQEDDFFYIKLGSLKPDCQPVLYKKPTKETIGQEKRIASVLQKEFPSGIGAPKEPLFHFVKKLSAPFKNENQANSTKSGFSPRFGYAYFALFGDPLLNPDIDPYPDNYLDRMAGAGMDGTWMHIVLSKITPFPWDPALSQHWEKRLDNLKNLVTRTKKHGIGIYLYLNEPRHLPLSFFEKHPELKGVTQGNQAALCTSHPDVQRYLTESLAIITERIPDLAGFFSITASENPTHCWSHFKGNSCSRCGSRGAPAVISELNSLYLKGIQEGIRRYNQTSNTPVQGSGPRLIAWDWGWQDGWAEQIIPALPKETSLMSVSEWDLPIERGGIKGKVGEYSISSIGPGPRALRHWSIAKANGLRTIAKIQAGNTWEIAAVPYIPALENVATHAANLRNAKVDGLMLGWTLGGHPSPNLEVVAAIGNNPALSPIDAMKQVAQSKFGKASGAVVTAWRQFSTAFSEFPYHIGVVYSAPLQSGPSNLLWEKPTGYTATMVGIAYDDINAWRSHYPVNVFTGQLMKVATGFTAAVDELRRATRNMGLTPDEQEAIDNECTLAETISIHYHSVANQTLFNQLRNQLAGLKGAEKVASIQQLEKILKEEATLAKRMFDLQGRDSRLGFEATNHYFYTGVDLLEKIINCNDLLDRWLPQLQKPS